VIRNYGAEIALRAALADAPAQIKKIENAIQELDNNVARFERQIAKAKKGAAKAA
jgi:archaellum component FlaC